MINIAHLLRGVLRDNPSPKVALLRLSPLLAIPVLIGIWGTWYRSQIPASGIAGDTSPQMAAPQDVGTVVLGQPVTGLLEPYGQDAWTIEGKRGQHVAIRVFSEWDSRLEFFAPDDTTPIGLDFNSGGDYQPWIKDQVFYDDGPHRIIVSGRLGVPPGAAGAYELHVDVVGGTGPASVEPVSGGGTMSPVGDGDAPILIKR